MKTPIEEFFEKENWVPKEVQKLYIEKEKQELISAWKDGCYNEKRDCAQSGEEYYNQTFKK
jgi:hypothetical protein